VVIAASACQPSASPSSRSLLPFPAPGNTVIAYLDDGRPVFVVRHPNGDASVLDAFSTHVPYGVRVLVAWCPQRRTFHDPRAGGGWDEWGRLRSGPPPKGLGAFDWDLVPGDQGNPGGIAVTRYAGNVAGPAAPDDRPMLEGCPVATWAYHTFDGVPVLTPAEAAASGATGWVLVHGRLDFSHRRLCSADGDCSSPAAVLDLGSLPAGYPFVDQAQAERWFLARVQDGALLDLAVTIRPSVP
jgi:hypothetical protein